MRHFGFTLVLAAAVTLATPALAQVQAPLASAMATAHRQKADITSATFWTDHGKIASEMWSTQETTWSRATADKLRRALMGVRKVQSSFTDGVGLNFLYENGDKIVYQEDAKGRFFSLTLTAHGYGPEAFVPGSKRTQRIDDSLDHPYQGRAW